MFKDDDEEEENTFGVTRYPCMPSLVALQQMRNRLHLAFLGRKLMKWTALATGREMRRLASELYDVYQGFGEDMRNAFILLARCRYFVPQLNSTVTEDINNKAGVVVQQSSKAVSGVKIVQFEIFETESPPYPHLGIEKGGQAILEAKKAWLDLLKRLIMMMQLRASFLMVELANKNATKKMNVLSKIVIPKTNVTMGYINNELEEYAREEFFRLKKVLEIKRKMYGGIQDPKGKKKKEGAEENSLCIACKEEISEQKTEKAPIAIIDKSSEPKPVLEPESVSSQENKLNDEEIDKLIKQLNEIVDVTTDMDEKGLLKASVDDFLKTAQVLKSKLGQKSEKQNEEVDVVQSLPCNIILPDDIDMDKLCDTCKEKYSKTNDKETQTDPTQNEEEKENALNEKESEEKEKSPSLHDSESDAELGTFETEFKEITKITKTINEDGSVTIKKKVIKIEREIRTPVRSKTSSSRTSTNKSNVTGRSANSSSHSNPYSGSRTVGLVTLKNPTSKDNLLSLYSIQRRVKSEILNTFSPMSAPIERFCMSSTTIVSSDIDFDYPMNDNNDNLSSSIRNNVRPSNNEA